MSFPILGRGYAVQVGYASENATGFGVAPTGAYTWPGAVKTITVDLDRQPIIIYRMDGVSRYPSFIQLGARKVGLTLNYIPEDAGILGDVINSGKISGNYTHSYGLNFTDIGQGATVSGCRANSIKFSGKVGQSLDTTVTYIGQTVALNAPSGFTVSPPTPETQPFYFVQEGITIGGVSISRILQFDITITNNVSTDPYQFGTDIVRALPTLTASATGTIRTTFENLTELNHVMNMATDQPVVTVTLGTLPSGNPCVLTLNNVAFQTFSKPPSVTDLIALTLNFSTKGGVSINTT